VFCVGVVCGSDLYTGVCECTVLYVVFSYALILYVHITSLYFLHVNQQDVPVRYIASDRCVCPDYYLFLFHTAHHWLPSCLGQSVLKLCKNRWG